MKKNNSNVLFDMFIEGVKVKGKETFNSIKDKLEKFDINDILKPMAGVTKTEAVDGIYSYKIEAPGFTKDALDINLDKGVLSIVGKSDNRELDYEIFIDQDTIFKVTLELGILEIKINAIESKKSTKVDID